MTHANVIIEADGGSRGNPGPAGFGALIRDADTGEVIAEAAESIGRATNNVAEYRGLIAGLELYLEHTPDALLEVRMDSKLVIEQMAGRWKIKHPDMRPLAIQAQRLAPFGTHLDLGAARSRTRPPTGWPTSRWTPPRAARCSTSTRLASEPDGRRSSADGSTRRPRRWSRLRTGGARNPMLGWSGLLGEPTTLVFLRHGETVHTAARKFSGPGGDDPGLNDDGWAQARRAGCGAGGRRAEYDAIVVVADAAHPRHRLGDRRRARARVVDRGRLPRGGVRRVGRLHARPRSRSGGPTSSTRG